MAAQNVIIKGSLKDSIDRGLVYTAFAYNTALATLALQRFMVRVPAGGRIVAAPFCSASDDLVFSFYSHSTISADGTPVTPLNRNREAEVATGVLAFKNTGVSVDGPVLIRAVVSGGDLQLVGATNLENGAFILNAGEHVCLIQNISAGSVYAAVGMDWYDSPA